MLIGMRADPHISEYLDEFVLDSRREGCRFGLSSRQLLNIINSNDNYFDI